MRKDGSLNLVILSLDPGPDGFLDDDDSDGGDIRRLALEPMLSLGKKKTNS